MSMVVYNWRNLAHCKLLRYFNLGTTVKFTKKNVFRKIILKNVQKLQNENSNVKKIPGLATSVLVKQNESYFKANIRKRMISLITFDDTFIA